MTTTGKWGTQYLKDLGERVGTTLIYGVITFLTMNETTTLEFEKLWPVVFLPTILSFLKSLLVNLGGSEPTASFVNVSSLPARGTGRNDRGAYNAPSIWVILGIIGIVLLVLLFVGVI